MAAILFAMMIATAIIIGIGMVSSTACNIKGGVLTKRVSALYFWTALGLALGLWYIWLGLTLFVEDINAPASELPYAMQILPLILSPLPYVCCVVRAVREEYRCKSLWETIAIYAIAAAALPSMYLFIASLNVF
jgi:hypothetical protein